jgi:hypothetical protein
MPISPTASISLRPGLIAASHWGGPCCSTGSSSRPCLWSLYRTRSSSAASISMKTADGGYESEMDTPMAEFTWMLGAFHTLRRLFGWAGRLLNSPAKCMRVNLYKVMTTMFCRLLDVLKNIEQTSALTDQFIGWGVPQDAYTNAFLTTTNYLTQHAEGKGLILGSAELAFELGFDSPLVDDYRMGFRSGKQPACVMFDKNPYEEWILLLATQKLPTHRFIEDLMDQNFHLVLDVTACTGYARNGP